MAYLRASLCLPLLLLACIPRALAELSEDVTADSFRRELFQRRDFHAQEGFSYKSTSHSLISLKGAAAAPTFNPYCDGTTCYGTKCYGYSVYGSYAGFVEYGCLQVSGIHIAQTHLKTIIVIDRSDSNNTALKLPGTNQNAYGLEFDIRGFEKQVAPKQNALYFQRALNVASNVFCSTGQFLPDGTLLSIGGSSYPPGSSDNFNPNADPNFLNGSFSIRSFTPCTDGSCNFVLAGNMTSKRWYPTAQILPDGRVLIVGGANVYGNIPTNTLSYNNPTVEYWPRKAGEGNYTLQFLMDTLPFNLYIFTHLLPSGLVWMFGGSQYTFFNTTSNKEVPGNYPDLACPPGATSATDLRCPSGATQWYRNYPTAATSALFPLTSSDGYTAEIMICGGNNEKAQFVSMGDNTAAGKVLADNYCWRIRPEVANPTWIPEYMCNWPTCDTPLYRVMGDMVLLVDGTVLVLNGAQRGFSGLKQNYATAAQLQPIIYNPVLRTSTGTCNGCWNKNPLPASTVPRMYHSSALLLHDGGVLVTGSNPNESLKPAGSINNNFPTEFRMEKFLPTYAYGTDSKRPVFVKVPKSVTINTLFAVSWNVTTTSALPFTSRFSAVLAYAGFSTHGQRHGMRNINLDFTGAYVVKNSVTYIAVLKAPPTVFICPPTWYWLFVLDNGLPVLEASAVNVTRSFVTSAAKASVKTV